MGRSAGGGGRSGGGGATGASALAAGTTLTRNGRNYVLSSGDGRTVAVTTNQRTARAIANRAEELGLNLSNSESLIRPQRRRGELVRDFNARQRDLRDRLGQLQTFVRQQTGRY